MIATISKLIGIFTLIVALGLISATLVIEVTSASLIGAKTQVIL